MAIAALDTTVLNAAADPSDAWHAAGLAIVRGVDDGTLPEGSNPAPVLAETLNGVGRNLTQAAAVDYLDRLEANDQFAIERLTSDAFATSKASFRRYEQLSFVDGLVVGHLRDRGLEYLYTFDGGFDGVEGLTRLETADDPFEG